MDQLFKAANSYMKELEEARSDQKRKAMLNNAKDAAYIDADDRGQREEARPRDRLVGLMRLDR